MPTSGSFRVSQSAFDGDLDPVLSLVLDMFPGPSNLLGGAR